MRFRRIFAENDLKMLVDQSVMAIEDRLPVVFVTQRFATCEGEQGINHFVRAGMGRRLSTNGPSAWELAG
jgi:hypothetical protein